MKKEKDQLLMSIGLLSAVDAHWQNSNENNNYGNNNRNEFLFAPSRLILSVVVAKAASKGNGSIVEANLLRIDSTRGVGSTYTPSSEPTEQLTVELWYL